MHKRSSTKSTKTDPHISELYDQVTRLETDVEARIQKLKRQPPKQMCQHLSQTQPEPQPYDPSVNYYDLCWKKFALNEISKLKLEQVRKETRYFGKKLNKIEKLFEQRNQALEQYPAAHSSIKPSLQTYSCQICLKTFKNPSRLNVHIKTKHGEPQVKNQGTGSPSKKSECFQNSE